VGGRTGGGPIPGGGVAPLAGRVLVLAAVGVVAGMALPDLTPATTTGPVGLSVPATCGDQWPMYQHGPDHHAAASCSAIDPSTVATLQPAWFLSTAEPVTASPSVVDGQVYVGDSGGTFYDVPAAGTGQARPRWAFSIEAASYHCQTGTFPGDRHTPSYGAITSSAMVATVPTTTGDTDPTVFFGGGGSLFALDAATGACRWVTDLDPANPTSAMEVESSPVLFRPVAGRAGEAGGDPEVIVGSDSNEAPGGSAPPGLQALDAVTGALVWKFEPENDATVASLRAPADTNGCGDVWSSPAVDPSALGGDGLVVTTTGNCPEGSLDPAPAGSDTGPGGHRCSYQPPPPDVEGIAGLDATTGCLVWRWSEPDSAYTGPAYPDGGDTDIGASPILATVPVGGVPTAVVIDGSKSGHLYALAENSAATGTLLWSSQPAQPGESGAFAGAIGGFIGSSAFATAGGAPTVFGATAIPLPFGGGGVQVAGSNGAPTADPDTTFVCVDGASPSVDPQHCDPLRASSLHAVDAVTGTVVWQQPVSMPSYAATTTTNGVVFAPSTTGFSITAYDADTGTPLWSSPTGGAMSSGAAVVGASVFVGAGTALGSGPTGQPVPPEADGLWCFRLAGSAGG
jgi:polyvinyl alcohol dehydrogenase (cytochrome)